MAAVARWLGRGTLVVALAPAVAHADPAAARARPAAAPSARDVERAKALHDEAAALYERGEYRGAISKLEAALTLDPTGKELVYNLALIHERLGEIDRAEDQYNRFLEMESDPKVREKVQATLRRLGGAKKDVARVAVGPVAEPAAPQVVVVGAPPPPAQPAAHTSPWVWVLGGTAATGLVVGTAFGITAIAKNPGANAHTSQGVSFADLQGNASTAHGDALVADLSFVAAALAAGAALFVYFTSRPDTRPAPTAASPAPDGSGLSLTF